MDISDFLNRLEKVRQIAPDRWLSLCPGHEDKKPSLSVKVCQDETLLIKCFTGCDAQQIVNAVGLELSDLFPKQNTYSKSIKNRPNYREAWLVANHYFWIIVIAVNDLEQNKRLSNDDFVAFTNARDKLKNILEKVNG